MIANRKFIIAAMGCLLGLMPGTTSAQKRPLDLDACTQWKRIDYPTISPTGRWVTYRINMMEYTPDYKEGKLIHLYDTRTRQERILPEGIEDVQFYDNDRILCYQMTDSTEQTQTMLMSLPSGEVSEWKHKEAFNPQEGTPYSISQVSVPQDTVKQTPAFNRLVIRNFHTDKAIQIDSIGYYSLYNNGRNIAFISKRTYGGNQLCYGPIGGPYLTLFESEIKGEPTSFRLKNRNRKEVVPDGYFNIKDSLWYNFSLKRSTVALKFDLKDIQLPEGMKIARCDMSESQEYLTLELMPQSERPNGHNRAKKAKKDKSFELELWTWDEYEVPTMQSRSSYRSTKLPKYIYRIADGKLTEVAPAEAELSISDAAKELNYVLYSDESPYRSQKDWLEDLPKDLYAVNLNDGSCQLIGKGMRSNPKWSPNGRYAVIYDPLKQVWMKFDNVVGTFTDISTAIGYPMYYESYDKPAPAPPYGLTGWSYDGNHAFLCDGYDWWKIDLANPSAPQCFTKGYGRKHKQSIRKMTSNLDKEYFARDEKIMVVLYDEKTLDQSVATLDMKGNLKIHASGPYTYQIHQFSDNEQCIIWSKQNIREFRDLWWSRADFSQAVKITDVNPQQKDYLWGDVRIVEWTNYANKPNRGLLYTPENYDPKKEYPVLVQFYETHTGEKNVYYAPSLSRAMADVTYMMSNGYVVFMPDVHFTIGTPYQSSYDAVVSGTKYLIEQGIATPGKIALQGHSWSGFQTAYLVTKTDSLYACASIGAPITDMVTGYLGIRNGSGMPRYFMYEETQSRMGKSLWEAKKQYLDASAILKADKIKTPCLIWHNDEDEAVAYEQGRALYLALRRLHIPSWHLNYKGEGHFLNNQAAQRDWTLRMKQFFDYYLLHTGMPRWMKEGIKVSERGIDPKYDLVNNK